MTNPPQYPAGPEDDFTGPPPYAGQGGYAGAPPYQGATPPYATAPTYPGGYGMPPQSNGLAVAGLVLGIISAVLFILNWIDTIVGVLAVVFSAIALSRARRIPHGGRRGMALWGLILGAVGVVASIATLVLIVMYGQRLEQRCEDHIGHHPTRVELRQCSRDGI
ncbi:MAG: DUF4190 domain-containing protein [Chloroflexota bacterium]